MDLDMIQGLAAGLAMGPRMISPAIWLPWVWDRDQGVRSPDFQSIEQFNTVAGWVMAQYNETVAHLGPAADLNGPRYTPHFVEVAAEDPAAAARFCAGLRRAAALAGEHDWAPLWAEWPQWQALLASPAPDAQAVWDMLAPMQRYWRGRTDRLAPLRSADVIGQLREAFEFFQRPFPRAAVALAERHREVVAPWLVHVLEEVTRDPSLALQDDYVLHDFAIVLLGHWRDTRAYLPLLALLRLPYDTLDEILGDLLFETCGRAVASVCGGDVAPLAAMVEDERVNVWVRTTLIDAWVLLVLEGDAPRGPLEDSLLAIGERDAARLRAAGGRRGAEFGLLETVAVATGDIASQRLLAAVLGWYDEKLIDTMHVGRAEVESDVALPLEHHREQLRERGQSYLRDPETEIAWWAGYHDDPAMPQHAAPAAGTIVRSAPKIGRNDPCPCGSGRKYKKCHGVA